MKKLLNKKMSDYTGGDCLKWIGVFTGMTYAICAVIYVAILKWEELCDFFKKAGSKIKAVFHKEDLYAKSCEDKGDWLN